MPAMKEAVRAAISIEPASAVPNEAPSCVAVFCSPPTSELFSVGTAETVTLPSCEASAPMPKPMISRGPNTIEESAPTSRLAISAITPTMSPRRPRRTMRRGEACGKRRGMPVAAIRSDSESGSSRIPVSRGDIPSATERNSGTVKNTPAWIRNRKRKVMSPPVSCWWRSSDGAMSGSLPARSSLRCQRMNSQSRERPAMMNQIVRERPSSDVVPSLGRIHPHVDDMSTPKTKRASPAADTAAPSPSM